jgi:hypothetical protein
MMPAATPAPTAHPTQRASAGAGASIAANPIADAATSAVMTLFMEVTSQARVSKLVLGTCRTRSVLTGSIIRTNLSDICLKIGANIYTAGSNACTRRAGHAFTNC